MAGHRLYRLPPEYRDGEWSVYDGTANTVYLDQDDLIDALNLEMDDDAFETFVKALPLARGASRTVRPRRSNAANNAGFAVHLAYDPVARNGTIYVQSLLIDDADIEETRSDVTWQQLVREGMALARDAQGQVDDNEG